MSPAMILGLHVIAESLIEPEVGWMDGWPATVTFAETSRLRYESYLPDRLPVGVFLGQIVCKVTARTANGIYIKFSDLILKR